MPASKDRVGIGLIGAGFLARTRVRCYAQVGGVRADIVAVAARERANAERFAKAHGIANACADVGALLGRGDVDLVDLCVPNAQHRPLAEAAAAAGKHVVCTKPLTAYVGQDLPKTASDADIAGRERQTMLEVATADAQAMVDACARAGVQLMYGENWLYAPAFSRALKLLATARGTVLEMRGGECHSGSHSPYSKIWRHTGGGALLRMGSHPLGAMLHVKAQAGVAPVAVSAEVGDLSRIPSQTKTWITTGWQDVENWGAAIVTFADGSRGVVHASDTTLGGMQSQFEIFASNCHMQCNLSPHDLLRAYAPDAGVFGDEYLMEKLDTRAGWSTPLPDEDWSAGHIAMCQDFVEAVAHGRAARSDGALGRDVVRVLYAAYVSAAEGRRVDV